MLTVLKAGLFTTIQDNGRHHCTHLGVPTSGAMDRKSAHISNLMLDNDVNCAVLECTFMGPTLCFDQPTCIAISGAKIQTFVNEVEMDTSTHLTIKAGDTVSFGKLEEGCRFYISIKGGFMTEEIWKSRSTCVTAGILKPIKRGQQISYNTNEDAPTTSVSIPRILGNKRLDVFKGPEYSLLSESQQKEILRQSFTILPESNRMAYRTKHAFDFSHLHSIISSGTMPGTVQLTSSGDLICLMRDAQTTGGYPRILQLSEASICDLSQLKANESFHFNLIDTTLPSSINLK